jgi:cell wall-associated NlpC family hydrolase
LQLTRRDQKAQNAAKTGARTMAKITLLLKGGSRSFLLVSALFGPVLTGCADLTKAPGSAVTPPLQNRASSLPVTSSAIKYALGLQGLPYRYGGTSPRTGFDCSGFVQHVYARYGIKLPRQSRDMAAALQRVQAGERCPGDLVFFHVHHPYSHVGIYLGQGHFIHAASRAHPRVMISALNTRYWAKRLAGFRRPYGPYVPAWEGAKGARVAYFCRWTSPT